MCACEVDSTPAGSARPDATNLHQYHVRFHVGRLARTNTNGYDSKYFLFLPLSNTHSPCLFATFLHLLPSLFFKVYMFSGEISGHRWLAFYLVLFFDFVTGNFRLPLVSEVSPWAANFNDPE